MAGEGGSVATLLLIGGLGLIAAIAFIWVNGADEKTERTDTRQTGKTDRRQITQDGKTDRSGQRQCRKAACEKKFLGLFCTKYDTEAYSRCVKQTSTGARSTA